MYSVDKRTIAIAGVVVYITLHVVTFFTRVYPWLLFLAVPLLIIGGSRPNIFLQRRRIYSSSRREGLVMLALLAYVAFQFVYFYRTTGGATSVGISDGHYVYKYKTDVLRTISEEEYRMFPNLITRFMSALLANMAIAIVMEIGSSPEGVVPQE